MHLRVQSQRIIRGGPCLIGRQNGRRDCRVKILHAVRPAPCGRVTPDGRMRVAARNVVHRGLPGLSVEGDRLPPEACAMPGTHPLPTEYLPLLDADPALREYQGREPLAQGYSWIKRAA